MGMFKPSSYKVGLPILKCTYYMYVYYICTVYTAYIHKQYIQGPLTLFRIMFFL